MCRWEAAKQLTINPSSTPPATAARGLLDSEFQDGQAAVHRITCEYLLIQV